MYGYAESIDKLHQEMRSYKHDIDNILLSVKILIERGDLETLNRYFDEKIGSMSGVNVELYEELIKLEAIKHYPLKSLLLSKFKMAKAQNIIIQSNLSLEIKEFGIDDIDLCRIFGILLDNAIEWAAASEKKEVTVNIQQVGDELRATISNSYNRLSLSNNRINRGIGLKSLKAILSRYNHVTWQTYVTETDYEQVLTFSENRRG